MLAATKHCLRQNIGCDKTQPLTKYWSRQNIGVDTILVATKYWIFFMKARKQRLLILKKRCFDIATVLRKLLFGLHSRE
jgi:hypothetical protein